MITMQELKPAIDIIKEFEGLKLEAYLCPANVWTIGYGTTVYPNGVKVKQGDRCTKEQADLYLLADVLKFQGHVLYLVTAELTKNKFCALLSFTYNVGPENLKKSTLLKKLNKKDFAGAALEFLKWNKAGGKVLAGLVRRRKMEMDLFNRA